MIRAYNPILHFEYADGEPLAGGWLYTFVAGSNTPVATYANAEGTAMNPTQILLNDRGECSVFLDVNANYKFRVMTPDKMDVVQEADNVCILEDGSISISKLKDVIETVYDADYFTEKRVGNQLIIGINEESVLARKGDTGAQGAKGDKGDKGDGLQIDKYVPTVASLTDGSHGVPNDGDVWFVEANKHLYGCSSINPLTWKDMGAIGVSDTTPVENITGILPIAKGGTSAGNAKDACNNLIAGLPVWEAKPNDTTYLIRQNTSGSETYGKIQFSVLWDWVKLKIQNVLGLTATAYQGKAKSAAYADKSNFSDTTAAPFVHYMAVNDEIVGNFSLSIESVSYYKYTIKPSAGTGCSMKLSVNSSAIKDRWLSYIDLYNDSGNDFALRITSTGLNPSTTTGRIFTLNIAKNHKCLIRVMPINIDAYYENGVKITDAKVGLDLSVVCSSLSV